MTNLLDRQVQLDSIHISSSNETTLTPRSLCNPQLLNFSMPQPSVSSTRHYADRSPCSHTSLDLRNGNTRDASPTLFCRHHPSESLRRVALLSSRPRLRCRLCSGEVTRQWRRSHPGQCAWQNLVLRAKRRAARMATLSCSDAYGLTSDVILSRSEVTVPVGRLGQAMVGQQGLVRESNHSHCISHAEPL